MLKYETRPARASNMSTLKPVIVLIDYRKIGTFEDIDVKKLDSLLRSISVNGWNGPAISVFKTCKDDRTIKDGQILSAQYGEFGVADGHNRLETLRRLDAQGLLKSKIIPVQLIPARNKDVIRIITLNPEDMLFSAEEIEACFSERTKFMPWSTSHFQAQLKDGSWLRLRECQPDLLIGKLELLGG